MLLISLQVIIQSLNFIKKKSNDSHNLSLNKISKNLSIKDANISATSVSDITGIPRATCIRKLDKFVKLNMLEKDETSKRYYLSVNQSTLNTMLDPEWMKGKISILANFSSIVMKGLSR